jgi:hypothetical protein
MAKRGKKASRAAKILTADEDRREDLERRLTHREAQVNRAIDHALAGEFTPAVLSRLVDDVTVETVRSYALVAMGLDAMARAEGRSDAELEGLGEDELAALPIVTKRLRREVRGG